MIYVVVIIGKDLMFMTLIVVGFVGFCFGWTGAMLFYLFGLKKKHKQKFKGELKKNQKKSELEKELESCDK